ncbi:hypothetical protein Q1695_016199 [Nippostrongylus brasiliensis]|nr:hypothetical protein Q1695_016199 [Nippostrongylus brasiliensis]
MKSDEDEEKEQKETEGTEKKEKKEKKTIEEEKGEEEKQQEGKGEEEKEIVPEFNTQPANISEFGGNKETPPARSRIFTAAEKMRQIEP